MNKLCFFFQSKRVCIVVPLVAQRKCRILFVVARVTFLFTGEKILAKTYEKKKKSDKIRFFSKRMCVCTAVRYRDSINDAVKKRKHSEKSLLHIFFSFNFTSEGLSMHLVFLFFSTCLFRQVWKNSIFRKVFFLDERKIIPKLHNRFVIAICHR